MTTLSSDPFADVTHADQLPDGLHDGIPFPVYRAQRAMNAGTLQYAKVSMAHVKAAYDGKMADTDSEARKFGRMVHLRLLEPQRWAMADIASPCCATLKSGDRKGEACGVAGQCVVDADWFCGRHAPTTARWPTDFATRDEAARIERMADAVGPLVTGRTEVTAIGTINGVRCKGRFDLLQPGRISDIKKCQVGECTIDACEKSILSFGWHVQAALYCHLAGVITGESHGFRWLFIEDGEPYSVVEIDADIETLGIGFWEVEKALAEWRRCCDVGVFPGPPSGSGGLPIWYRERVTDERIGA